MKFSLVLSSSTNKTPRSKLKKYNNFCGEENIPVLHVANGKLIFPLCSLSLLVTQSESLTKFIFFASSINKNT